MKPIIIFITLLILGVGCKKKEVTTTETEVVFYFNGTVNNTPELLEAGKNNYYMFTDYHTQHNNIIALRGQLKQQNCTRCGNELLIELLDNTTRANGTIGQNISNVLAVGRRDFLVDKNTINPHRTINFKATNTTPNCIFNWDFGDTTVNSALAQPSHTYTTAGFRNVCLTTTLNSNTHTLCNYIDVTKGSTCNPQFTISTTNDSILQLVANTNFASYSWAQDSMFIDTTQSVTLSLSNYTIYNLSLTVNNVGCSSSYNREYYYDPNNTLPNNNADFTYSVVDVNADTTNYFSKVHIQYSTPTAQYSSNNRRWQQPNTSYFTIDESTSYHLNETHQKTYKLKLGYKAWLYNTANPNDSIPIQSTKTQWSVAYP